MSRAARLNTIRATACPPAKAVVRSAHRQDNRVVLERTREALRGAIDESGWKHEAVAAAMTEAGVPVDPPYLSKMLGGEKPIGAKHIEALPDEIEAIYSRRYAESFGHIVVAPVDEVTARKHLVSGLLGVLAGMKAVA